MSFLTLKRLFVLAARVRSNLVFLRVKTTPLQEEKGSIEALNLTTGFRITYKQLKSCIYNEADLAIPHSIKAILETLQWNSDGEISQREPSSESYESMTTSTNSSTTDTPADDDTMWDYLDMHSEDKETDEKDLYDF